MGTWAGHTDGGSDFESGRLFCGISDLMLPVEHFEFSPGFSLRQTYSHVIAPFLMAFRPPERPGQHHAGPLKVLAPGGFDVFVELDLAAGADAFGFTRLNALWFSVALLRLKAGQSIQASVLSDHPFSAIPDALDQSRIFPFELNRALLPTAPMRAIEVADLEWVRDHLHDAAHLMKKEEFNRSFQTLDQATFILNGGAGIVTAWAAIETLIRPGSFNITKRLAKALAVHLYEPGAERDRAYGVIEASYTARGGAAHAGRHPQRDELWTAFDLGRRALRATIENAEMPDVESLLERWRTGT